MVGIANDTNYDKWINIVVNDNIKIIKSYKLSIVPKKNVYKNIISKNILLQVLKDKTNLTTEEENNIIDNIKTMIYE